MIVNDTADLGRAIHARRRQLGLTQEALADITGRHRRVISEIERGKRSVQLQIAIDVCRALGLNIELTPR